MEASIYGGVCICPPDTKKHGESQHVKRCESVGRCKDTKVIKQQAHE
uniref:Uncharacterized protein n=1 Tax=Globisporangium ultimum (strain ATCC 200006 / CBS 805.95 / DAOM BR144) TaxID=431595 RepID=K3WVB2_GLOUD